MQSEGQFQFVGKKRRPVEDKRFILGQGNYVADVKFPKMGHIALLSSPHAHAKIVSIDTNKALNMPGVIAILTGDEIVQNTQALRQYLDIPSVKWYPLAAGVTRYAGEWVAAVVATERYLAEDALEMIEVQYEPLPFVLDPVEAMKPEAPRVHEDHSGNVVWQRKFVWGSVEEDFAQADFVLSQRYRWNRNSTVPLETFGVVANYDTGRDILHVYASIQMPQYAEQIADALSIPLNHVSVHYDIDVGGSYGTKRGIKHTVLTAYLSRKLGIPVKFIEDRLEYMRGSDMHGPDRIFDVSLAFGADGMIHSMRMRTIDDEGAYPGRSPLQMGKPIGAIVGAYKIKSVEYEGIAVTTNKTGQVAVRGFGQAPTNFAIELSLDEAARKLGISTVEIRRRNFIQKNEFPYTIPSGTVYDSGDFATVLQKTLKLANYDELIEFRDQARQQGRIVGIGIATCMEPGGGNALFEPLFNSKNDKTTFPEGCFVKIDSHGKVTAEIGFSSAGQGHQTLVSTVLGEELGIIPEDIQVVYADSLRALPSQSPVASRMAIVLGGAVVGAAKRIKEKMLKIAAHNLGCDDLYFDGTTLRSIGNPSQSMTWMENVDIAHKKYHKMPPDMDPGLQSTFVWEVPTGGVLPTADGRVHMYPCYSFSAHIPVVEIDRETGEVTFLKYALAHDCGTVINPDIVRGMVMGGIAHGIGAALYEQFVYDDNGQLVTQSFMDYLLPSAMEIPHVDMDEHCTPSPHTPMGQKGVGEGGYMSAPAAVMSAINDALAPFNGSIRHVPAKPMDIFSIVNQSKEGVN